MESHDFITGISPMAQGTSGPQSSHMWLGSGRPQSIKRIASLPPHVEHDSSPVTQAIQMEPVNLYHWIVSAGQS
jgi:hypothetical protein